MIQCKSYRASKNNSRLKGHCSLDFETIILASNLFNNGYLQIYLFSLPDWSWPLRFEIMKGFLERPLQETFETGLKSRSNFPDISALQ